MGNKVKVWDVPTRLFHWTLLAMFAGMWLSAENGQLLIHTRLGVAMLVAIRRYVVRRRAQQAGAA